MSTSRDINTWLMAEARLLGESAAIVDAYANRLCAAGVPLARANISQILANPLLIAWGMIWTPAGTSTYDVPHEMLRTASYIGGPFEYVLERRVPLHKSLRGLDPGTDHAAYLELAEGGGTDFFANLLEYGDGSAQGCTYVTNAPEGFAAEHIALIHDTRHGLAAALEPAAMRSSTGSLLRTYLGNGPAKAVVDGTIMRGEHAEIDAVVLFTDMRGFTRMSESLGDAALLDVLNRYFDVVVAAVDAEGGDVLKLLGDGILSIFPVASGETGATQCAQAVNAAFGALSAIETWNRERAASGLLPVGMGAGINRGALTYGNIGSPGRLDFTVLGAAVNIASRVQDLCKTLGEPVLVTTSVTSAEGCQFTPLGAHPLRGIEAPVEIYKPRRG